MLVKYFRGKSIPYTRLDEFDPLFDENSSSVVSIERHNNYTENRGTDEESDNCCDDKERKALIILLIIFAMIMVFAYTFVIFTSFNHQNKAIDYLFIFGVTVIFLIIFWFVFSLNIAKK